VSRIKLRFGGYQPEASVHTRAVRAFISSLRDCDVAFDSDVTQNGHRAADLLTMVERGDLDFCYFSSSYLAARVPALGVLDLPFRVSDRAHAYGELDGVFGRRLADDVEAATGFYVLSFWDNGFRHISNRLHPIRGPADCVGMKIRTLDNVLHRDIFRAFGFVPMNVDVKNLAAAVVSHEVDAQENPLTNLVNFGLHRTHRFVSLTAHFFGVALLLVNKTRFDALPDAVRQAIRAAAAAATQTQRALAAAEDARCLRILARDGVQVALAEEIDLAAFRAVAVPLAERETQRLSLTEGAHDAR